MKLKQLTIYCALGLISQFSAHAQNVKSEKLSDEFTHMDWTLQCDNTRTCHAAGFQIEKDENPISMKLTRSAGPNSKTLISVKVQSEEDIQSDMKLMIGKNLIGSFKANPFDLNDVQSDMVLNQITKATDVSVLVKNKKWILSLKGLNAALVKMDESQGRLGTPGALIKKGTKDESSVLPTLPAPVVKVVKPVLNKQTDAELTKRIASKISLKDLKDQCNDDISKDEIILYRLTDKKILLSASCPQGAYNSTSILWMANDKEPYNIVKIEAEGEFDQKDGSVFNYQKGRGLGDCGQSTNWHFDGNGFVMTSKSGDSMCRGIPGGAWGLPSLVTILK